MENPLNKLKEQINKVLFRQPAKVLPQARPEEGQASPQDEGELGRRLTAVGHMYIPPGRIAPEGFVYIENNCLKAVGDLTEYERDRREVMEPIMVEFAEEYLRLADIKARAHDALDWLIGKHGQRNSKRQQENKQSSHTIFSLDRSLSLSRKYSDRVKYDDVMITAAKELIDKCVEEWEKGSRDEMKQLVALSFKRNANNEFSRAKIVELRQINSKDPRWKEAMDMIQEAELVDGVASYLLVSVRDAQEKYHPLPLDISAVRSYRAKEAIGLPAVKPVRSQADYLAAMEQIKALMQGDPAKDSPEGERLEVLAVLAEAWEVGNTKQEPQP